MKNKGRVFLIDSIKRLLIPEFERLGFSVVPLSGDDLASADIRRSFPFGRLQRKRKSGLESIEIQLDKNGFAACRFNIGVVPIDGIHVNNIFINAEDVWVHYLNKYYAMYSIPIFRRWFTVNYWFGSKPNQIDFDKLVQQIIHLIPEVEKVLAEQKIGKHIRLIG